MRETLINSNLVMRAYTYAETKKKKKKKRKWEKDVQRKSCEMLRHDVIRRRFPKARRARKTLFTYSFDVDPPAAKVWLHPTFSPEFLTRGLFDGFTKVKPTWDWIGNNGFYLQRCARLRPICSFALSPRILFVLYSFSRVSFFFYRHRIEEKYFTL